MIGYLVPLTSIAMQMIDFLKGNKYPRHFIFDLLILLTYAFISRYLEGVFFRVQVSFTSANDN